ITDNVSITNTQPMITSMIFSYVNTAIAAIAAPNASDPVAPINTLADCVLKTIKPNNEPTTAKAKIVTSNCGLQYQARLQNLPKAITAVSSNKPSSSSVKLTALEAPTSMKIIKNAYPQSRSHWICVPGN